MRTFGVAGLEGGRVGLASAELKQLTCQLDGPLLVAGDEGWDEAVRFWNAMVTKAPALVVQPASAHHVAAAWRVPELRPWLLKCSFLDQPTAFMRPVRTRGSARRGSCDVVSAPPSATHPPCSPQTAAASPAAPRRPQRHPGRVPGPPPPPAPKSAPHGNTAAPYPDPSPKTPRPATPPGATGPHQPPAACSEYSQPHPYPQTPPPRPSPWGWGAAPRFPDSVIGAISCCELPVQVLVEGLLRGPAAVNFARSHGLLLSIKGGGHNIAGTATAA
jgi:hypothetical protein